MYMYMYLNYTTQAEEVEYTCSSCKEQSAMLSHQISKLPR